MEDILKKLDLQDYIESFQKQLARRKAIHMEGDINLHHRMINDLSKYDIKAPHDVENIDWALMHIQKQGLLKVDTILEFVKIIKYFSYLK